VNEAALFAVRRGAQEVHKEDFDAARDRVLMGLRRESLALSEEEKEIVAYHEAVTRCARTCSSSPTRCTR